MEFLRARTQREHQQKKGWLAEDHTASEPQVTYINVTS